ncbi:unnamed protein product [Moneuplotes crassus]|uniref:Uncharacterized protein n=1 Tax=Euplotes crassus TaxID=5936 RepID=A0AAD1UKB8_EUPCR|nr:unnamed protein product [Moneuplotes crassus]
MHTFSNKKLLTSKNFVNLEALTSTPPTRDCSKSTLMSEAKRYFDSESGAKIAQKFLREEISSVSRTLEYEEDHQQKRVNNEVVGLILSILCVALITIVHVQVKLMNLWSPYLTVHELLLFMGVFLFIVGIILCVITKSFRQVLHYSRTEVWLLVVLTLLSSLNNCSSMYALDRLPLSKTIFMLSLRPTACAVIAFITLRERFTIVDSLCLIGGSLGVYILTLSTQDDNKEESFEGYFAAIICIWAGGAVAVIYRKLNLLNVHSSVVGVSLGVGFIVQPFLTTIFIEKVIHFEKYSWFDLFMNASHGLLCALFFLFMFVATFYIKASVFSPRINLENGVTVVLDVLLFHYHFTLLDLSGMVVLGICIFIPILVSLAKS